MIREPLGRMVPSERVRERMTFLFMETSIMLEQKVLKMGFTEWVYRRWPIFPGIVSKY